MKAKKRENLMKHEKSFSLHNSYTVAVAPKFFWGEKKPHCLIFLALFVIENTSVSE